MKQTSCGIAIVNREGELLLCHATGSAHWDIPKGLGEAGETARQTAVREATEETGLQFAPDDLLDLGCMAYRPGKDLHLYATLLDRIDLGGCICTSTFVDHRGRTLPEADAFEWTPFARVPERCAKNMAVLLTQRISLPDVLQQLLGLRAKPAAPQVERLFVALWPDAAVQAALAAVQKHWRWPPRAALVRSDKLHATLHFLGNVACERIDALQAALDVGSTPFELHLSAAAVWHGGIAVLETDAPPALLALHAALDEALTDLGLPVETRPYRPHVTLARKAQGALPPAELPPLRWRVDGHALVRSAGGDYTVLTRYPS